MADDEVWDDDDAPSYNPVSTGNIDLGSIVARYSTNSNTGSGAAGGDGYTFDNNKENRDWGSGRPNRQNDNFGGDRGSRGPMKCYNCNEEGHASRDCTQERRPRSGKCFKCQEEGHNARDCPNPDSGDGRGGGGGRGRGRGGRGGGGGFGDREAGGGGGGRGSLTCFNCQEEGHTSKDCTNEKRPRAMKCYKCQEEGHVANDCTKLNKKAPCCNCGQMGHATSDCQDLPEILRNGAMQSRASVGMPTPHIPVDIDEDSLFATGVSVGVNFDAYDNIPVNVSGRDPPQKINNFDQSGLRVLLLENVKKAHYNKPTPIQSHSIPVIMRGRDLMACAQTGSGKTAAFLLPILHHILQNNLDSNAYGDSVKPACLILSPTRELSIQTYNEARKFSIGSVVKVGIVYGGTSVTHQLQRIKQGCHILVATPGRLLDYLSKSQVSFENLQFLVLDEADRMLDMGFGDNVRTVVNHPSTPPKADRRTLMFSATFSDDIQRMAKDYLNDYVFVVVGTVGAANADVKQIILEVPINERREMLVNFLKNTLEKNKNEKILVFAQEKRMADFIGIYLCQSGIQATTIHGDRYQSQREEALNEFKRGVRNVLVATAVAARGLDIEGVGYVVNFDLPKEVDEYVHRIGRTGRVGNRGCAISYFNKDVDGPIAKDLLKILREANQSVPDWLEDVADSSYPSGSFDSSHNFGARDIRRSFANPSETSAAPAFGGPACSAAADEPMWDE